MAAPASVLRSAGAGSAAGGGVRQRRLVAAGAAVGGVSEAVGGASEGACPTTAAPRWAQPRLPPAAARQLRCRPAAHRRCSGPARRHWPKTGPSAVGRPGAAGSRARRQAGEIGRGPDRLIGRGRRRLVRKLAGGRVVAAVADEARWDRDPRWWNRRKPRRPDPEST